MPTWTHAHTLAATFIGCCCAAGAILGVLGVLLRAAYETLR
jgi:hypothetical protein